MRKLSSKRIHDLPKIITLGSSREGTWTQSLNLTLGHGHWWRSCIGQSQISGIPIGAVAGQDQSSMQFRERGNCGLQVNSHPDVFLYLFLGDNCKIKSWTLKPDCIQIIPLSLSSLWPLASSKPQFLPFVTKDGNNTYLIGLHWDKIKG